MDRGNHIGAAKAEPYPDESASPPLCSPRPRPAWSASQLHEAPMVALGQWLAAQDYHFITVTPDTHRRVRTRCRSLRDTGPTLRDIFGWSRGFDRDDVPVQVFEWLRSGGACEPVGTGLRSRVRYSKLDPLLLLHSAYPTEAKDAVFFGPDTYRFAGFIRAALAAAPRRARPRVLDVGCGSGAGGLLAARLLADDAPRLTLSDISAAALRCAAINAAINNIVDVHLVQSDAFARLEGAYDWILCNPPYLQDAAGRAYRDGGAEYGCELALRIVREALPRLAPGGRLLMYSGAAVVAGEDQFLQRLRPLLTGWRHRYEEIDPDVFGEELDNPAYATVERIAAVSLTVEKPRDSR